MQHNVDARSTRVWFGVRWVGLYAALLLLAALAPPTQQVARGQGAAGQTQALDVKFRGGQVRLRNGVPVDESAPPPAAAQTSALLRRIGRWERTHLVSEQDLERLRD